MPRVNPLTAEAKIQENIKKISRDTKIALMDAHITYVQVAAVLGISKQAVSHQFRQNAISLEVWLAARMLLEGDNK